MAQKKTKAELRIENRLKFFICSIAFNGSDGFKLENLNDLYEEKVFRDEEPCRDVDTRSRYSCEPSPFLVSACLMKKLKKEYDTTFENAPRPGRVQPVQQAAKSNPIRRKAKSSPQVKPTALPVSISRLPKTAIANPQTAATIKPSGEPVAAEPTVPRVLSEYLKVQQTHTKCERISALKQLLMSSTAGQQTSAWAEEKRSRESGFTVQRQQAPAHERASTYPQASKRAHGANHESNRSLQSISLPDLACPMASLPDFSCSIIEHAPSQEAQSVFGSAAGKYSTLYSANPR